MRKIDAHEVNPTNSLLEIRVADQIDYGANHNYEVWTKGSNPQLLCEIKFQKGPVKEKGTNGITQEVLLAIVADRLQFFQNGPLACRDNAVALTHVESAMLWLQKRTLERLRRGVESTMQA